MATYLKREIGEKSNNWTLGDFLTKTGYYKQAENYYRLLESLPNTETDRASIYNRIAYVRYERKDYAIALDYLEKAKQCAPDDSEVAIVTEYNQRTIINELSVAMRCAPALRRRLENYNVNTKYLISNPASKPIIINNFGRIYHQQGDFERALEHYHETLRILPNTELSFLLERSAVYNNIGCVEYSKGNYTEAVKNFYLAMTTLAKLDPSHPWIREYTENWQAATDRGDPTTPNRLRPE